MAEVSKHGLPDFLLSSPPSVVLEFAKAATDFTLKGERTVQGYKKAASELHVTVDVVIEAVELLCNIYIRGVQDNISTIKMEEVLLRLGFERNARQCLVEHFSLRRKDMKDLLANPRLYVPSYKRLEWRLDIQIASRSLLSQKTPSFLLKLSLNPKHLHERNGSIVLSSLCRKDDRKCSEVYVEADYCTLKAILANLEQALAVHKRSLGRLDRR